ncbi:LapA family protein [Stakelama sp. CBK3Z-3]|uniref:LapA family protein n=1 Tax=Stakelama flava TaxID=2860338 RepID=A0ABS6XGY7_9SPHN|nr:LapA family protein [Stakelama flava]MBW4329406.1 LapA family protein [Stakelama flava]
MQFLKTLFWALLIGLGAAFAYNNWVPVDLHLWGGLIAEVNLPLLLLVSFLIGFVPMLLAYYTMRWRLRQRISNSERALADLRAAHAVVPPPAPDVAITPAAPAPLGEPDPIPVREDGPLFESPMKKDDV